MVDYNDIGEKNGDGEEVRNTNFSIRVTREMGRPLLAYLRYYDERFDDDLSLADPENILLAGEEDELVALFTIPGGCEDEHSVGEFIAAGEKLAETLNLRLDEPGVPAVIAAYLQDRMSGVIRLFCQGKADIRRVAVSFVERLQKCLSAREGRECWPEIPEEADERFRAFLGSLGRHADEIVREFAGLVLGPARTQKFLAA